MCRFHANFSYQAGTWTKPRRVIVKVEWHPGELYSRVGFIVTNHEPPGRAQRCFLQQARDVRGDCRAERSPPTRCGSSFMRSPTGNFLRTLATPEPIKD
jgi:hypothetical protein